VNSNQGDGKTYSAKCLIFINDDNDIWLKNCRSSDYSRTVDFMLFVESCLLSEFHKLFERSPFLQHYYGNVKAGMKTLCMKEIRMREKGEKDAQMSEGQHQNS
jgi:hypothetical protein